MAMKYIVFDLRGSREPVVFPASFNHAWVAEGLKPLKPLSAGFVHWESDRPVCWGRSEGLRLSSDPERDSAALQAKAAPEQG